MRKFHIAPVRQGAPGAVFQGEAALVQRIGSIQNKSIPELYNPHILVFAADHGIAATNPSIPTHTLVADYLQPDYPTRQLCAANNIKLIVIDAGVNYGFQKQPDLIINKVKEGTSSFIDGPAMNIKHAQKCIDRGAKIVDEIAKEECNIIGFAALGNCSEISAAALMCAFTKADIKKCIDEQADIYNGILSEYSIIKTAFRNNEWCDTPLKKLAAFGGFEIVQMAGAMLRAAELGIVLVIDSFVSMVALLAAFEIDKNVTGYALVSLQYEQRCLFLLNYMSITETGKGPMNLIDMFQAIMPMLTLK